MIFQSPSGQINGKRKATRKKREEKKKTKDNTEEKREENMNRETFGDRYVVSQLFVHVQQQPESFFVGSYHF